MRNENQTQCAAGLCGELETSAFAKLGPEVELHHYAARSAAPQRLLRRPQGLRARGGLDEHDPGSIEMRVEFASPEPPHLAFHSHPQDRTLCGARHGPCHGVASRTHRFVHACPLKMESIYDRDIIRSPLGRW